MVLEKCETIVRNWQTFAKRGREKQGNRCFFFDMNELEEERQIGHFSPSSYSEWFIYAIVLN
jgi:hypothetical protein